MKHSTCADRRGFSYLEVQTALALLGVALAGLAPIMVVQLRLITKIEKRLKPSDIHYLVPAADEWTKKLGASAINTTDSVAADNYVETSVSLPAHTVSVDSFVSSASNDTAIAVVSVTP